MPNALNIPEKKKNWVFNILDFIHFNDLNDQLIESVNRYYSIRSRASLQFEVGDYDFEELLKCHAIRYVNILITNQYPCLARPVSTFNNKGK